MKFALLIVVLAALANVMSAATHLKGSSTVTEKQIKELTKDAKLEKAKSTLKSYMKKKSSNSKLKINNKTEEKMKNQRSAAVSKQKGVTTKEMEGEVVDVDLEDLTTRGWAIEKIHPNSDCSGKVHYQSGLRLGLCQVGDSGTSYYLACEEDIDDEDYDDAIRQVVFTGSEECEGDYMVYSLGEDYNVPECDYGIAVRDEEFLMEEGYATASYRCRSKSNLNKFKGLTITVHNEAGCNDEPIHHGVYRNGACMLSVNDGEDDDEEEEGFEYLTFDCNEKDDSVSVKVWADPECNSGLLFWGDFDAADLFDEYKQCTLDEDDDEDEEDDDGPEWIYAYCNSH
jgi:hypothetical protein